jgi:hypothetical protein
LQFERLEAALAAKFHRSQEVDSMAKYKTSTLERVATELAKPRMARSARIAGLNLDTTRTSEQPSTTMPGTVDKSIRSLRASQPEEAQIAVDKAGRPHRDFRIQNTLTDEHGDDAKLKKGAHLEVMVIAKDAKRRD